MAGRGCTWCDPSHDHRLAVHLCSAITLKTIRAQVRPQTPCASRRGRCLQYLVSQWHCNIASVVVLSRFGVVTSGRHPPGTPYESRLLAHGVPPRDPSTSRKALANGGLTSPSMGVGPQVERPGFGTERPQRQTADSRSPSCILAALLVPLAARCRGNSADTNSGPDDLQGET